MAEKLRIGELRKGSRNILCYATITCFDCIEIKDVNLFQARDGTICLGLPQRSFVGSEGKTMYVNIVKLTEGAREGLKKRLHQAYLSSPLSDPDGSTTVCQSEEADPW